MYIRPIMNATLVSWRMVELAVHMSQRYSHFWPLSTEIGMCHRRGVNFLEVAFIQIIGFEILSNFRVLRDVKLISYGSVNHVRNPLNRSVVSRAFECWGRAFWVQPHESHVRRTWPVSCVSWRVVSVSTSRAADFVIATVVYPQVSHHSSCSFNICDTLAVWSVSPFALYLEISKISTATAFSV